MADKPDVGSAITRLLGMRGLEAIVGAAGMHATDRFAGCKTCVPVGSRWLDSDLDAVEASSGGERRALRDLGEVLVEEHPGDELLA